MQNECEVYVDPEEDEVFFGFVSDKERSLCAKINSRAEDECVIKLNPIFQKETNGKAKDLCNSSNESVSKEFKSNPAKKDVENSLNDSFRSLDDVQDANKLCSGTVELEHNYSTPMKEKIDKSILSTPNSMVKADQDGGFLKVLSEIALVKAEVDACKKVDAIEKDDDKENKMIPTINVVASTPEKQQLSPPFAATNIQQKKLRCVFSPPKFTDLQKFENLKCVDDPCRNFNSNENEFKKDNANLISEEIKCVGDKISPTQSSDLINLNEAIMGLIENKRKINTESFCSSCPEKLNLLKTGDYGLLKKHINLSEIKTEDQVPLEIFDFGNSSEKNKCQVYANDAVDLNNVEEKHETSISAKAILIPGKEQDSLQKLPCIIAQEMSCFSEKLKNEKSLVISENLQTQHNLPRFSKDAKEVIDVIKKSTINDSLNFTVQELDVENIENSFLSPEIDTFLNETTMSEKKEKATTCKLYSHSKEAEKKFQETKKSAIQVNTTLALSQDEIQSSKCFTKKELNGQTPLGSAKSDKNSPVEEMGAISCENKEKKKKEKESNLATQSRIPVLGAKSSKLHGNERNPQISVKTPMKTPSGKIFKNSKFNNIESPISAYIHNKPTSLVLNIKAESKKEALANVWKSQGSWSERKIREKSTTAGSLKSVPRLPFVEYKSGASYEIEKRAESRLPRLAPTFQKLIGARSPKVLKHQGRFYVKTPRREGAEDCTVVAEPNEVSLVVSQQASKTSKRAIF